MKVFRYFITILLSGFVLFILYNTGFLDFNKILYYYPCQTPILYKAGTIDPRFGLSPSEVADATKQASDIWNTALGKRLFSYDSEAELTINMVYDRRQLLRTQINELESGLKSGKTTLQGEVEKFEKRSADFEKRLDDFNKKIDYWNARGGAPQEEYDSLIQEQKALSDESNALNSMARELNLSAGQYNNRVGELNQTLNSFNNALQIRPEEGVYDPQEKRIDVFFNDNRAELVRTIAHELGHARGLSHSPDRAAIMYPTTTDSHTPAPDEVAALEEICRKRPFYEPFLENLSFLALRFT